MTLSRLQLVKTLSTMATCAAIVMTASPVRAFSGGITTLSFSSGGCNECHSGGTAPSPVFSGPDKVLPGSINTYTLLLYPTSPATQDHAGFNVSALSGSLGVGGALKKGTQTLPGTGGRAEVTHTQPKRTKLGNAGFSFIWTAPGSFSSVALNAWGNSVNFSGTNAGDAASMTSLTVTSGAALCAASPTSCLTPGKSSLTLSAIAGKQSVAFKWSNGATTNPLDFGSPAPADYALCLYKDSTLAAEMLIPASSLWNPTSNGFKYKNANGLLQTAMLAAGDVPGKAKVQVKGKGAGVGLPATLPFSGASTVTAQIVNAANANCWGDVYSGAEISGNAGDVFKAKAAN